MKRKVADELADRRSMEMAALWGNPNFDQEENPELRQDFMHQIDEGYSKAIARLYGYVDEEEKEIDESDPWWQAMKRGIDKRQLPDEPKLEV